METEIITLVQKRLQARYGNKLRNKSREWQEAWIEEFEEGFRQGILLCDLQRIQKKIQKGKSYEKIADEIEIEDYGCFKELFTLVQNYPNYSAKELLKVYLRNQ